MGFEGMADIGMSEQGPRFVYDVSPSAQDQTVRLAIGIDNLALLEELFGQDLGAEVIDEVRNRIHQVVPQAAEMSETHNHHFVIAMERMNEAKAVALAERVQEETAADTVTTSHGPVGVTITVGIALAPMGDGKTEGSLACSALHALHAAKSEGVGNLRVARDEAALLESRATLLSASRATLGSGVCEDLAVAFQPVVSAEGSRTISFHECLARISCPDGRVLTASAFMPAIESLGLAPVIDRHMLIRVLEVLTVHPGARFSINIFPQTMQDRQWLELFESGVRSDPSLAERLIVEITESAAMLEPKRTSRFIDRFRAHGVSFAMDDFGAGHTSIRHLRDFRFDMIKIDGRLITGVDTDPDAAFLVEKLVQIAERFDMMTVAESVQSQAEARTLQAIGVEFFQGFRFGSPSMVLEPTPSPMPIAAAQA